MPFHKAISQSEECNEIHKAIVNFKIDSHKSENGTMDIESSIDSHSYSFRYSKCLLILFLL